MKLIFSFLILLSLVFFGTSAAFASPIQPNFDNPNVVAYYPSGIHTIVGEQNDVHTGIDIVMAAGGSGNFQQWFLGTSTNEGLHGDHSVWLVQKNGSCANGWTEVVNAYPSWGDYLQPGANYCVKTNEFSGQH